MRIKGFVYLYITTAILITIFSYTAISKVLDFGSFKYQMLHQPLPEVVNNIFIWTLPVSEFLIAAMLLKAKTRLFGYIGSTIIMAAFTIYVALMVFEIFDDVPCSCGGIIQSLTWSEHLLINIALLIGSIIALKISINAKSNMGKYSYNHTTGAD